MKEIERKIPCNPAEDAIYDNKRKKLYYPGISENHDIIRDKSKEVYRDRTREYLLKEAQEQVAKLKQEEDSAFSEIKKIERELKAIENAEPQIKERADWYESFGRLIRKHRATTSEAPTPLREGEEYKRLSAETTYAQNKRDKIPLRRKELENAKKRLIPKQKLLYDEYKRKRDELQKMQEDAETHAFEPVGEVTATRIQKKRSEVNGFKEQLYEQIKAHTSEHAESEARKISTKLKRSRQELEKMEQKFTMSPEVQDLSTRVRDAHIQYFEACQCLKAVAGENAEIKPKRDDLHKQYLDLPKIEAGDSPLLRYRKLDDQRAMLYAKQEHFSSIRENYIQSNKNLREHMALCEQSRDTIQEILDDTGGNHTSLPATKEELKQLQKQIAETRELLYEQWDKYDAIYRDMRKQRNELEEKDLPKVRKEVNEVIEKLDPDHPYFSWYERSEYDSEKEGRHSIKAESGMRGACVVSSMLTIISDQAKKHPDFAGKDISSKEVAEAVELPPILGGAKIVKIPEAFEKLRVPETYHCVDLKKVPEQPPTEISRSQEPESSSLASLEKVLQDGPAIVSLLHQSDLRASRRHSIVVDKIEQEDPSSPYKYVYIRDALGGIDGKGESYKVRAHVFQAVWDARYVAVLATSLKHLDENEYRIHPRKSQGSV